MATGHPSLRTRVEKLIGTRRYDPMRVSKLERSRVGQSRCVCVRIEWSTGSFSLSFFGHAEKRTWAIA
jgi:hypothetical protein